jgi:hypothetical protein
MAMMRSKATHVHLVTVLEEMPVQETLDAVQELHETTLPVGHVIVNLVQPTLLRDETRVALTSGTLGTQQVAAALETVALDPGAAPALIEQGHAHLERQALQDGQRERLESAGRPVIELPTLQEAIDQGALFELARVLRDDLLGRGEPA